MVLCLRLVRNQTPAANRVENHQCCERTTADGNGRAKEKSIKPHWLPTHRWHAKRFPYVRHVRMASTSSHQSGYRAIERLLREGRTLLQDITWRMQRSCGWHQRFNVSDWVLVETMCRFFTKKSCASSFGGERFGREFFSTSPMPSRRRQLAQRCGGFAKPH
jgi:hypothetical protein